MMDDTIRVALISSVTAALMALLTVNVDRYNVNIKNKKEELKIFISSNKTLLSEIIKIAHTGESQYAALRREVKEKAIFFLTIPKGISDNFFELYEILSLQGQALEDKSTEIKSICKKILIQIRKAGVGVSDLGK